MREYVRRAGRTSERHDLDDVYVVTAERVLVSAAARAFLSYAYTFSCSISSSSSLEVVL